MPDGVMAVEVAAHQHAELRTRAPAGLFGQLQDDSIEHDGWRLHYFDRTGVL